MWRRDSCVWSRLLAVSLDRFPQSWESLEEPRRLKGASQSLRDAPGVPEKAPEASSMELRGHAWTSEESHGASRRLRKQEKFVLHSFSSLSSLRQS